MTAFERCRACRVFTCRLPWPRASKVSENPVIWVIDGLCDGAKTRQLKQLLEAQDMDLLRKTESWLQQLDIDMHRPVTET